jgi:hypothetical protein
MEKMRQTFMSSTCFPQTLTVLDMNRCILNVKDSFEIRQITKIV